MSQTDDHTNTYRRKFLGQLAAVTATGALGSGLIVNNFAQARPADEAVSSKVRYGLLVDTSKCGDGCNACVKPVMRKTDYRALTGRKLMFNGSAPLNCETKVLTYPSRYP